MFTPWKEKTKKKYIDIYKDEMVIYQGKWDDLPLSEEVVIEKSILFFNDPEPCYIHRDAVRVRLLAELEQELHHDFQKLSAEWLKKLSIVTGFAPITHAVFSDK
jgi:hypothetical protein